MRKMRSADQLSAQLREEKYDDRMDPECVALCDVLNTLPGIRTFESCCGHGEHPFIVFFRADRHTSLLLPIVRAISSPAWMLECGMLYIRRPNFAVTITSEKGDPAPPRHPIVARPHATPRSAHGAAVRAGALRATWSASLRRAPVPPRGGPALTRMSSSTKERSNAIPMWDIYRPSGTFPGHLERD